MAENNNNNDDGSSQKKDKNAPLKQKYEVYDENNNVITMEVELVLLHLIQQNDIDNIKECDVVRRNLNYLEKFPDIDIDNTMSPLIAASYLGRVDIVKLLLTNPNIDVDFATKDLRHTPLTVACLSGNYEILIFLLQAGAEVNKPTVTSYTPFVFCFQRLEVENNQFENRKICLKMVDLLLEYGSDINWIVNKQKGYTLLMQLCALKIEMSQQEKDINYEIIKFLIENGANKSLTTFKGKTAYDLCSKHSNCEKIRDLLVNGQQKYFHNKPYQALNQNNKNDTQSPMRPTHKKTGSTIPQSAGKNLKPIQQPPVAQEKHKRSKSLASYLMPGSKKK